jgi:hypothetical protein
MLTRSRRGIAAVIVGAFLSTFMVATSESAVSSTDVGTAAVGTVYTVRIDPTDAGSAGSGSALGAARKSTTGVRDDVEGQVWYGHTSQKWKMKVVGHDAAGNWIVTFQNLWYSNICLDKSTDTSTSSNVYLYTCHGDLNQQWILFKKGSVPGANTHEIINRYSWEHGSPNAWLDNNWDSSWVGPWGRQYAIYVL